MVYEIVGVLCPQIISIVVNDRGRQQMFPLK